MIPPVRVCLPRSSSSSNDALVSASKKNGALPAHFTSILPHTTPILDPCKLSWLVECTARLVACSFRDGKQNRFIVPAKLGSFKFRKLEFYSASRYSQKKNEVSFLLVLWGNVVALVVLLG